MDQIKVLNIVCFLCNPNSSPKYCASFLVKEEQGIQKFAFYLGCHLPKIIGHPKNSVRNRWEFLEFVSHLFPTS